MALAGSLQPLSALPMGLALPPSQTPGAPASIILRLARTALSADGRDGTRLVVLVRDGRGRPVADGTAVSLATTAGAIRPAVGTTEDGLLFAWLRAGNRAGEGIVQATAGDVSVTAAFSLQPVRQETVRLDEPAAGDGPLPFNLAAVVEQAGNTIQEPGDGRPPFVERPSHRAQFTEEGLIFLPQGNNAPAGQSPSAGSGQGLTLTVAPVTATIGGVALNGGGPWPATVEGNVVRVQRGPNLVAEAVARDGGIEQRWLIPNHPRLTGDLVLAVEVETGLTLARAEGGDGFVFRYIDPVTGEMTPVAGYGRALALDAAGRVKRAWLAAEELEPSPEGLHRYRIEMTLPAAWLEGATYPVLVDPLIGSLLRLDGGLGQSGSQTKPSVAYNSANDDYLVVWQDEDLYGQLVDGRGIPAGDGNIVVTSDSTDGYHDPDLAYNPDEDTYLVVWSDDYDNLWGQILQADGYPFDSIFQIDEESEEARTQPAVAYSTSAGAWMVAWQAWNKETGSYDIKAQAIYGSESWEAVFTVYSGGDSDSTLPDVAANDSGGFLVVWEQAVTELFGNSDLYAQRVTIEDISGSTIELNQTGTQVAPAVTYNADDDQYLVVWQDYEDDYGGSNYDAIWGQRFYGTAAGGTTIGSAFNIEGSDSADSAVPAVTYHSALTGTYLVAWKQTVSGGALDIQARRVLTDGTTSGVVFTVVEESSDQADVALGFGPQGTATFAAWTDGRAGDNDIHGRLIRVDGTLGSDYKLHPAAGDQVDAQVSYNPDDDQYLVVWEDYRAGTSNANIYAQRVAGDGLLVGENITVTAAAYHQQDPHLAYGSDVYLVAWRHYPGLSSLEYDAYAAVISRTGTVVTNSLVVASGSGNKSREAPTDVVYNGDTGKFLVLYQDLATGNNNIWSRHVAANGAMDTAVQVTSGSGHEAQAVAAYDPDRDRYLVAWSAWPTGVMNRDIDAVFLTNGGVVTPTTPITITGGAADEQAPDVVYLEDGGRYAVVWHDSRNGSYGIYGQVVLADGSLSGGNVAISTAGGDELYPHLALDGSGGALAVWQRIGFSGYDVYGRRVGSDSQLVGDVFTIVAEAGNHQLPAIAGNGSGRFFLAWQDFRNANWDIYGQPFQLLQADFTAGPRSGEAPLQVQFSDASSPAGAADQWLWDFGDGSVDITQNPTHVYTETGAFTVTLAITDTDTGETDTLIQSGYVTVSSFLAISKSGPGLVNPGEPITYMLTVSNSAPVTITNLIITDVVPSTATYVTGGTLVGDTVNWTVASVAPGDIVQVTFVVTATTTVINDDYAVTADNGFAGRGEEVVVTYIAGLPNGPWWDDDFFYRRQLTLTTTLPITDADITANTVAFALDTPALIESGKLTADGQDLRVTFRDELGWHVLPTLVSESISPTVTITFSLQTVITDTSSSYWLYYGNQMASPGPQLKAPPVTAGQIITNITGSGSVTPTISFFAEPRLAWAPATISFTSVVTPEMVTYTWDFGDSITSAISNTDHLYTAAGVYTVTLTAVTTESLQVLFGYQDYIWILADRSSDVIVGLGTEEIPAITATLPSGQPGQVVSAQGNFSLTLPGAALTQTLVITHTPFQAAAGQNQGVLERFDLSAAAAQGGQPVTQFSVPVALTLDYLPLNITPDEAETILFFYWDESLGTWAPLTTTVDIVQGVATAITNHLSDFAVASNYGLGGAPPLRRLPSASTGGVDLLTGAATYVYPLEVPMGTNGMEPNLSLVYNSGAADTLLDRQAGTTGLGFELAGLGWIQPAPDPEFGFAYYLTLNGVSERLIEDYDEANVYHTERQTFWHIERKADGNNGVDQYRWLVTMQDGAQYQFGSRPDSTSYYLDDTEQVVYRYNLDQVQDLYGNTMSVTYDEETATINGDIYEVAAWPETILYTENSTAGLDATRKILFVSGQPGPVNGEGKRADYPTKDDEFGAGPGQTFAYSEAIIQILMLVDANGTGTFAVAREYDLDYTYYTQGGATPEKYGPKYYHLMLSGITEKGTDVVSTLPATSLEYAPTGHLATVENGYGGAVDYVYSQITGNDAARYARFYPQNGPSYMVGSEPDTDRWRVIQRTISTDSGNGDGVFTYDYGLALFAQSEFDSRIEFRGHQEVTVTLSGGGSTRTRLSLGNYDTLYFGEPPANYAHLALVGRPYEVEVTEGGQTLSLVKTRFSVTESGGPGAYAAAPAFVHMIAGSAPAAGTSFSYDNFGNVVAVYEWGDLSDHSDNRLTAIAYEPPPTGGYVTNRPSQVLVKSLDGSIVAQTAYSYTLKPGIFALGSITVTQTDVSGEDTPPLVSYTQFDAFGNVAATWTGSEAREISIAYDTVHQTFAETVSYPGGGQESYQYDARFGIPISTTDLNGLATAYTLDPFGRVKTEIGANGPISYTYSPSPAGLNVVITYEGEAGSSDDFIIEHSYNGLGYLVRTSVPGEYSAIITDYGYNVSGQVITATVPYTDTVVRTLETTYDALGRPRSVETVDGTTIYTYPSWQEVIIDDALWQRKSYTLDAFGRVTAVTEANQTTAYEYDLLGNLTRIVDAESNETTMTYDSLGRKTAMTDPDMGSWSYTYSSEGDLNTQTDGRGVITTLGYDALGRVITKTYTIPTGSSVAETEPVAYTYSGGLPASMSDGSGSTVWVYDPAGRLLRETKAIGSQSFVTFYRYDVFGRLEAMTYPDGEVVTYDYNAAGQLQHVAGEDVYLDQAVYDSLGQPTTWNLGNGIHQQLGYDDSGTSASFRPQSLDATNSDGTVVFQDLEFSFDLLGRLDYWADNLGTSYYLDPAYDSLNRLAEILSDNSNYSQDYGYDGLGNLLNRDGLTLTYNEPQPHLPTSAGPFDFAYDTNGNLITKTVSTNGAVFYLFDAENRLTQVISDTNSSQITTTFKYDGNGQLVSREVLSDTTVYVGDYYQATNPIGEINASQGTVVHDSFNAHRTISVAVAEGGNTYMVWRDTRNGSSTSAVYFRKYDAAQGRLQDEVLLSDPNDDTLTPRVAADSAENIYVTWSSPDSNGVLFQYYDAASEQWLAQPELVASGIFYGVDIGVDSTSKAYVALLGPEDASFVWRSAAGVWSVPEQVSPVGAGNGPGGVSIATNGQVVGIAWQSFVPPAKIYYDQRSLPSGSWGNDQELDSFGTAYPPLPDLEIDDAGAVYAVWHNNPFVIFRQNTTGTWQDPVQLGIGAHPSIGINPTTNELTVVWSRGITGGRRLFHTERPVGSVWTSPQLLEPDINSIYPYPLYYFNQVQPEIDVNASGLRRIIWADSRSVGEYGLLSNIHDGTKRYFAGSQQIATRLVDGSLYYVLNDPTGTSLVMADENGNEAGRLLYDGFGAVLTSTIPVTLTGATPDFPDAATGLLHLSRGRWYDPFLGRPLQPNPAGSPPTVPQALNRYAAGPLGQPGVAQATAASLLDEILSLNPAHGIATAVSEASPITLALRDAVAQAALGYAAGKGIEWSAWGPLTIITSRSTWYRTVGATGRGLRDLFLSPSVAQPQFGKTFRAYTTRGYVRLSEEGRYLTEAGDTIDTSRLPASARIAFTPRLNLPAWAIFGTKAIFAFGVSAIFQWFEDADTPYLTGEQKVPRILISGAGGFFAFGVAEVAAGAISGSWAGPVGIVTGGVMTFVWISVVQPVIFDAFGLTPKRDLAILTG
jgi:uncharacterized repeat protein (TIGR01451 family)